MPKSGSSPGLFGRQSERERLGRLVADARTGHSQVLVLHGEAGIGKSALLEYVVERADGFRIIRAAGAESEMELAYAGLQLMCGPYIDRVATLPPPQREALEAAFGLRSADPPDRLMVGLAMLTLSSGLATERPLLFLIDDAQWLDLASAQALQFVARRLGAEPIGLVFAVRDANGVRLLSDLPDLPLRGLATDDAAALLEWAVPGVQDPRVRDRMLAEAHGNPLALLELPRTWLVNELAGGFGAPDIRPTTDKIEQSYLHRVIQLPLDTQLLLLTAAAEPLGDPALLNRALQALGVNPAAISPAIDANLLELRARVEFAHPLVRSAIYRAATIDDRCRVHRALAESTDQTADPERRAWHDARATVTVDEDVAAALERSAVRARSRGGLAAAAAFLSRATELTPDPTTRVARAIEAAFAHARAGAFEDARGMAAIAAGGQVSELQRAQIDLLRAHLAFASSRGAEATSLLLAAGRRLEGLDVRLARETYLDAFAAALYGGRENNTDSVHAVAQAARGLTSPDNAAVNAADLLLIAFVALANDYGAAVPRCRAALDKLLTNSTVSERQLRWLSLGLLIALELWDDERADALSRLYLQTARDSGALSELELALGTRAHMLVLSGEMSAAELLVAEGQSIREATGISGFQYGALIVSAWRGRDRELIDLAIRDAETRGQAFVIAGGNYALAVLCNSQGRYSEARIAGSIASEHELLNIENYGLPELVESATRTGQNNLASAALARLTAKTQATGTDWALGIEARSRALLNDGDQAERLFREAITRLSRTHARAELARAHLLFGEWLRREGRRAEAREHLRVAHETLAAMGIEAFAERAQQELAATGEKVRKRVEQARNELTAQELHVARMALQGLSNIDIAARLFLSPRTVEWHLGKVFLKLGIKTRAQLHLALAAG